MKVFTSPNSKTFEDPLASFLGMPFHDPESFALAKKKLESHSYPRKQIASILKEYNRSIGNDELALKNAAAIADPNSSCIITGQQLGMMGGPIYTILKGISCLLLARQTGTIPIYWLATEDHDIAEIDHTYCLDSAGNLKKFHLSLARDSSAVEDIKLTQKNCDEINAFWSYLGTVNQQQPVVGELYSHYMATVLKDLFAGTGMVFLEPKLLRSLAIPFFSREIEECQAIRDVLKATTRRLVDAGGKPVINVEESTNLFLKNQDQKRLKIRFDGTSFTAGQEQFTLNALLSKIQKDPQSFSCNVAARPTLQNTLLPVIAYIAGPSELEYHKQLGDYHQLHGNDMPVIVPRISATFIPPHAASILEASGLNPWNDIPTHLPGKDVPGSHLHFLRNLINPHNEPQERLLNWWDFQSKAQENLLAECLKHLSWDHFSPYYLYL